MALIQEHRHEWPNLILSPYRGDGETVAYELKKFRVLHQTTAIVPYWL
jgi:hypothetical protein